MNTRMIQLKKLYLLLVTCFTVDYHPRTYIESGSTDRMMFLVVYAATTRELGEMDVLERMLASDEYKSLGAFVNEHTNVGPKRLLIPLRNHEEWEEATE